MTTVEEFLEQHYKGKTEPVITVSPFKTINEDLLAIGISTQYMTINKILSFDKGEELLNKIQKKQVYPLLLGEDYGVVLTMVDDNEAIENLIARGTNIDNFDSLIRGK
jgi:hypothetical protein